MLDKPIDFIIYDKQGPFSNAIRHVLKKKPTQIHRIKKIQELAKLLQEKKDVHFSLLMFVFNEDFEFMDYLELEKFDVPIVFAPTNKRCYDRLCKIEGIWTMDISRSKQEYIQQITDFLELLQYNK
ncbi:hypothetical protein [Flagellimonas sp. CMM7]|uniref:hypothetical protein n=1 Tax=Flagellimonas sp. CMM7 TaxID=2654676 RepID=UPI0013D80F4D|nr:hypothetical protein [Flagellimonas sp. CMM7]UII78337.1 hypothetical protein LV704_11715 [Flagellimonas sp. CMM7]